MIIQWDLISNGIMQSNQLSGPSLTKGNGLLISPRGRNLGCTQLRVGPRGRVDGFLIGGGDGMNTVYDDVSHTDVGRGESGAGRSSRKR
jgi:hypothetical protein